MAFPETERVVYERNTLEEVKCQIRFPPILTIENSTPGNFQEKVAAFQESIRNEFPFYELRSSIKLPVGIPSAVSKVVERDLSLVGTNSHAFSSEDRNLVLELTKDGLSLTCRQYERWERFRDKLDRALTSLAQIFQPSFYLHTCVRYKNSVRRKPLDIEQTPWKRLLQPWVSGALNNSETEDEVEALEARCRIRLPDGVGRVDAMYALGIHQPSKEAAFIIQAHVYHETKKELKDVLSQLDVLHWQARLFFRWCITEELHRAMRPGPV